MLELNDVLQASERIRPYIVHTPLLRTPALDELIGCQVYIKPEMFQLTGSFKVRGASSRMTLLTQQERERGWLPLLPAIMPKLWLIRRRKWGSGPL